MGLFDGACQGSPMVSDGKVSYLSDAHHLEFKAALGSRTNNWVALNSLLILSRLELEKGCHVPSPLNPIIGGMHWVRGLPVGHSPQG
jgi:hypothetical protein